MEKLLRVNKNNEIEAILYLFPNLTDTYQTTSNWDKDPKQCMESLLGCSKKQASLLTEFLMQ